MWVSTLTSTGCSRSTHTRESLIMIMLFCLSAWSVLPVSGVLVTSPASVDGDLIACAGDRISLTCTHTNIGTGRTTWRFSPPINCFESFLHDRIPDKINQCGPFAFEDITHLITGVTHLSSTAVATVNSSITGTFVECSDMSSVAMTNIGNVSLCVIDQPTISDVVNVNDGSVEISWQSGAPVCGVKVNYTVDVIRQGNDPSDATYSSVVYDVNTLVVDNLTDGRDYTVYIRASVRSCSTPSAERNFTVDKSAIIPEEKNDGRADTGWIIAVAVVVPVVIVVIIIISIICALVVLALKRQNKSDSPNFPNETAKNYAAVTVAKGRTDIVKDHTKVLYSDILPQEVKNDEVGSHGDASDSVEHGSTSQLETTSGDSQLPASGHAPSTIGGQNKPPTSRHAPSTFGGQNKPPTSVHATSTFGGQNKPPTSGHTLSTFGGQNKPPTSGHATSTFGGQNKPPTSGRATSTFGEQITNKPPTSGHTLSTFWGQNKPPTSGHAPSTFGGQNKPPTSGRAPSTFGGQNKPPTSGRAPSTFGGQNKPPTSGHAPSTSSEHNEPPTSGPAHPPPNRHGDIYVSSSHYSTENSSGRPGSIPRDSAGSSIGQYHTGQGALKEVGGISRSPGVATGSSDLAANSITRYHTEVGGGHRPVNQRRINTNPSSRTNNSDLQTRPVTERQRVPGITSAHAGGSGLYSYSHSHTS